MRNLSLAFLIAAVFAIQACKNPESRSVDSPDSGSMDVNGQNTVEGVNNEGNKDTKNVEETQSGDITHKTNVDDDSAFFIKEAGTGGLMEVRMANIALKNASAPEVIAFAKQMVMDHGKANKELRQIARKNGVIIPTEIIPEKRAHVEMLKKLSGAQFDKQYMDMMVTDHQKTVELFKSGQSLNKDDLVAFAKKTTPVIEKHYNMAKEIKANLK
jgi:putative membrane protein